MTDIIPDATEGLAYTTEDFKKYVFAQAQEQIWRLHESIRGIEMDCEDREDLHCVLDVLSGLVREAAFVDAGQAIAEEKRRKARAEARRAEHQAHADEYRFEPFNTEELRERLQDIANRPAPSEPPREPFDPIARLARLGVENYSHGGPVATAVRFGEADDDYAMHVWHPDPEHPDNQPEAEHEFCRGPHPFRFGLLEVTVPGSIRIVYEDEDDLDEDEDDLTEDQARILEALRERRRNGMVPSHQDAYNLAQQLGMTEQQVIDAQAVLGERGLTVRATIYLTEDQQRVLNLLPNVYDCDPCDQSTWGPTTAQIAERLGMSTDEVCQHQLALSKLGWASDPSTAEREGADR